ncbi:hypothetical protein [Tunicatimonas pelagia]|uniref:hypothetical protein n=1 Tax=Tunicatimonas pelagia TaxID=931531 RepID=UPI0026652C7A|nr:hypothetical protein [Tunicatimonas pelagia]WKN45253.1 hypothetical protein P0M28_09815 [Tunicatimonas pelagia]
MLRLNESTLLFLLGVLLVSACKTPLKTTDVSLTGSYDRNTLQMSATGYGETEEDAEMDAYRRALDAVMFRGFPQEGSSVRDPLIMDKAKAVANHEDFFDKLYSERLLEEFILSSSSAGKQKQGGQYESKQNISFNLRLLRKRLQDEGIIRKFGI